MFSAGGGGIFSMTPELCIVTAYDEKYSKMARFCVESIQRYAAGHKLASCVGRIGHAGLDSGRPPAWEKISAILEVFRRGYPWALWIDADAAFVRFDVDIRQEMGAKDLYLVIGQHVEGRPNGMVHQCDQPCTGFMLVRNCAWSIQFLQDMWERTEFTNHCWWELAAFIQLAGIHLQYDGQMKDLGVRQLLDMADPARPFRQKVEIDAHIGRLHQRWNCTDQSEWTRKLDPIVRHYTGSNGPFNTRLALADSDYFRIFNRHL
jgi:Nucleotide-diphospho-sugar transferase